MANENWLIIEIFNLIGLKLVVLVTSWKILFCGGYLILAIVKHYILFLIFYQYSSEIFILVTYLQGSVSTVGKYSTKNIHFST